MLTFTWNIFLSMCLEKSRSRSLEMTKTSNVVELNTQQSKYFYAPPWKCHPIKPFNTRKINSNINSNKISVQVASRIIYIRQPWDFGNRTSSLFIHAIGPIAFIYFFPRRSPPPFSLALSLSHTHFIFLPSRSLQFHFTLCVQSVCVCVFLWDEKFGCHPFISISICCCCVCLCLLETLVSFSYIYIWWVQDKGWIGDACHCSTRIRFIHE